MNYKMILKSLGAVLYIEAACMLPSLAVAIIYAQGDALAFLLTIIMLAVAGTILNIIKPETSEIYARDGFAIVSLSWIIVSVFGSLPFLFSGATDSFIDALFETISGFTTTGSTVFTDVESLPKGILFWRNFTNWLGGMGVLVLTLAVLPSAKANTLHIMKAESPGPDPEKLVPKIGQTAKILYMIYIAMTLVEIILLLIVGMPLFDALVNSFGSAGTGGFSIKNISIEAYHNVSFEIIIAVFMFLFGVNFTLYYQSLRGNIRSALKDGELRFYFGVVAAAILIIAFNITGSVYGSFGEAIRYALFQVSSIITTTGYSSTNFNLWPALSKSILVLLMFIGASAGSTGGGIKCIRILILLKIIKREVNKIIHPRSVYTVKVNEKAVDEEKLSGIMAFFAAYIIIFVASVLVVSLDNKDLVSTFTAVAATLNNIGPGLEIVGPAGNFSSLSDLSKVVCSFCMIAGRLEIYPALVLFSPMFWKKVNI
jgi:trk system potassium uptake protein TrkH